MTQTVAVLKSSELRTGMIVATHGAHVLLDGPIGHNADDTLYHASGVFYVNGAVIKRADDESTARYMGARWTIQGNDNADWCVIGTLPV